MILKSEEKCTTLFIMYVKCINSVFTLYTIRVDIKFYTKVDIMADFLPDFPNLEMYLLPHGGTE
jgi:hypothetical protein